TRRRLVGGDKIERPEKKLRRAGGRPEGVGTDTGHRQEAAQPLGPAGDEAERGNGERFGCGPPVLAAPRSASLRHHGLRKTRRGAENTPVAGYESSPTCTPAGRGEIKSLDARPASRVGEGP